MLKVKTFLRDSLIQGIGLFADEDIKKGKIVSELTSLDVKIKKDDILNNDIEFFNHYFSYQGEYYQTYFDNMRFMNHSDNPNCIDAENGTCIAIKDIKKGEELTCDYSIICKLWQ
jgi:SET domain-containing protein